MEGRRAESAVARRAVESPRRAHRGGVLFEVLLAVALFVGAGTFALASVKSVFAALDRTRREQELVDLARSRMAEFEAGLINLSDLRGEADLVRNDPAASANERINDLARGELDRLSIDVQTSRSEFTGLSLVEITVGESDASIPEPERLSYTLRQLMPLGGQ